MSFQNGLMGRKRVKKTAIADTATYNGFCSILSEGDLLVNMNKSNGWGEYLIVALKATFIVANQDSYFCLLMGAKVDKNNVSTTGYHIYFTPDKASMVPFLRKVGHCDFELTPVIKGSTVNKGLIAMYSSVNAWNYSKVSGYRKPKTGKYDTDGKPVVRQNNEGNEN